MKNKVSYTNKWMHHYPQFWHEEQIRNHFKIIVIDKEDAPKIVKERVKQINLRRYEKNAQWFYLKKYSLQVFIRSCEIMNRTKKQTLEIFLKILNDERRIERIVKKYGGAFIRTKDYDAES